LALLVRFQPVATDMRRVLSTMKLGGNLERIADQSTSIARRARKLNDQPSLTQISLLGPMFRHAFRMVKESITAITNERSELALEIKASDKELDRMNREIGELITREMASSPDQIFLLVHLLFIGGSIERIGDLAKAISEDAVFLVEAEDIRHARLSKNPVAAPPRL
ncbi:MAG: PhoU domain-containing protein, partial [Verrucomicrobiia bacterium]